MTRLDFAGNRRTSLHLLCKSVMQFASRSASTRHTEGVGFEPTVGFPTLDFESSALNRTQPPFQSLGIVDLILGCAIVRPATTWAAVAQPTGVASRLRRGRQSIKAKQLPRHRKNVTILGLPCLPSVLHLVYPHGQLRYCLLLTAIHRFLAPLFTSIRNLFRTSTLPHRHDSTQAWNPARFTN